MEGTSEEKVEEYGNKWRYRCPFDTCEKNAGKGRAIGYKVCVELFPEAVTFKFYNYLGILHPQWSGPSPARALGS